MESGLLTTLAIKETNAARKTVSLTALLTISVIAALGVFVVK
jgi:hypothetical protein